MIIKIVLNFFFKILTLIIVLKRSGHQKNTTDVEKRMLQETFS